MKALSRLFSIFLVFSLPVFNPANGQQLNIEDFVLFGGDGACPAGPGQTPPAVPGCGAIIGVGSRVLSGNVGSYRLVHTNGDVQINGKIHSGGSVNLGNNNICTGIITANNSANLAGTIMQSGSGVTLGGNIDVKGNVVVGGGTVSGRVTHPVGTTYSGPVPGGGDVIGAPSLPIMPDMPPITVFPAAGATNITATQTINPGSYGNVTLSSKTLTFNGAGIYVFKSIKNSGVNTFRFDLLGNLNGVIQIFVYGDVNLAGIQTSFPNGGDASRVYMEVQGKGSTNGGNGTYACIFTTGFNWSGTIWAPFAAIKAGSGSSQGALAGCFWSGTQVDIEHGIRITHIPPYKPCKGSLTIIKQLNGTAPSTDWEFTSPQLGTFTIPAAGGAKTFNNLDPGSYTVTESVKPEYVVSTSCQGSNPNPATGTLTITACENLSCTFTNTYTPSGCVCLERFALFAIENLQFKGRNTSGGIIAGGSVGVNRCRPNATNQTLTFGDPTFMPTDKTGVVADYTVINSSSDLYKLFSNFTNSSFNVPAVLRSPPVEKFTCPIYPSLPSLPAFTPGTVNITVQTNASQTITAGTYGDILVKDNGSLVMGAGVYTIQKLDAGQGATIITSPGTIIRAASRVSFANGGYFGPADDVLILVRSDNVGSNDRSVNFSRQTEFHGQIYAPNGIMGLGHTTKLFGLFWSKRVSSDWNVSIECVCTPLSSFFPKIPTAIYTKMQAFPRPYAENLPQTGTDKSAILGNFPNPCKDVTAIRYRIAEPGNVSLKLYDVHGKELETLLNAQSPEGIFQINWDARNKPKGMYLIRLQNGEAVDTRKIIVSE